MLDSLPTFHAHLTFLPLESESMDNRPVKYLLGPWLIGTCIDLVIQGVLSAQFVKYFETSRGDKMLLKAFVAILAIMTTMESIQTFAASWIQLIVHFGDLAAALNLNTFSATGGIFGSTIALLVQGYFCLRLYTMSEKRWYVLAPPTVLVLFAYVANLIGNSYVLKVPQNFSNIVKWYNVYLPSVFAADIVITLSIAYFLVRSRRDDVSQSAGLLKTLMRLAFQTAAPATICALVDFVISRTFPQYFPGGREMAAGAVQLVLPKLYAFSLLWTLNDRANTHAPHSTHEGDGSSSVADFHSAERDHPVLDAEHGIESRSQTTTVRSSITDAYSKAHHPRLSMARSDVMSEEEMVFATPEVKEK
ncbi:hypothetical protein DFH09DRAFT_1272895 [Mycena vulgaris]|nr:hypothetical protein DFH09DRAFT_1272895 [Mycena vulgaris]